MIIRKQVVEAKSLLLYSNKYESCKIKGKCTAPFYYVTYIWKRLKKWSNKQ